ncbi:UDP-4-amino-4,6-dideoxy-N-acetyl-beta-L-altrosamine transaminase [Geobacter hydrogenophilus]|uniref:UDP-4-amino-4, 6-dideoxy-N-acetyl-beta-L-altrosamine transaminase n=1 Tax=Geobacter hydrogenophilus TaxID=40983 RepID=A0A9W6G166_9BACT|nr:UDP-4-amino-4,6-dideoxy-N-acetyl-beta-L-altrosamine transaminase [Geobacter hydrogenophilus]MBT0894221.1 UDP-4-amino-4,6-dideoxy-N-acetyl-beta-L-altrosamine transaminase [Geobacter hydrogenophilus]GLI38493.1 UDP-4-amino-4,6-dideoxy-N-acetyl-beta-L-altrosamine transaminase [Geobacter hydrogenophilus]
MSSTPIPYGRQSISPADIQAVVDVLNSDWLTQGPTVERFERTVADYCGAAHAVAVNSATSALHIACLAAGLGPGDILWTSPNTFVASANCGLYCGATVDFVDIDPRTYNMSVERLEEKLERAAREGKLPKVVIPVHFAGQSCDMEAIARLAERYGFIVIEDASHAIGGRYKDEPVGNCRHSTMTVFSFHPVKIITTGEGGMVLTNSAELHERLLRLRSHGITRDPALMKGESHGPWYYEQIELGFNYRMTDIQAALGVSQMTRLEEFVERRHHLAKRYNEALAPLPLTLPWQQPDTHSAFHLYVIRLSLDRIGQNRRHVFETLRERGILVNLHYIPVHTQPYYWAQGFKDGDFPAAEAYYREALSLPLYAGLSAEDQDRVIAAVQEAIQ